MAAALFALAPESATRQPKEPADFRAKLCLPREFPVFFIQLTRGALNFSMEGITPNKTLEKNTRSFPDRLIQ
jgi:hypothetical protein